MKLNEVMLPKKAGFIPYITEETKTGPVRQFMFMIPSDANFGGTKPSFAKGMVDPGENSKQAAIREAEEELGLKQSNLKTDTVELAWNGIMHGDDASYAMTMYIGEVKSKSDFNKAHWETGSVWWMTAEEFIAKGRKAHISVFKQIVSLL